jgi:hypothetical protein
MPEPPADRSYEDLLERLAHVRPRIADRLRRAHQLSTRRLRLMLDGVRLHGLEEWLGRLERVIDAWDAEPRLASLAPLIRRALGDYEGAIEAALSGYPAIAFDAMRDIVEIEHLLLDFYIEPARVEDWLQADRQERLNRYGPRQVRSRVLESKLHEIAGGYDPKTDYAAHSEALHVTPPRPGLPFEERGLVENDHLWVLDVPFWEMYEHARRLGNAVLRL